MVVKFFKMTSPKAFSILLHALTALIVIEFFLYKFVGNEGCVIIMYISEQSVNQLSKINGIFKLNFNFKFK